MTGFELYEKFCDYALRRCNCEWPPWDELDGDEQKAWDDTAEDVELKD